MQPRFERVKKHTTVASAPLYLRDIMALYKSYYYLPPTKEEVYVFARVCLSVCLSLSNITQNACMDLDKMLRVDRCRNMDELINF